MGILGKENVEMTDFLRRNEIVADVMNFLIFRGRQVIHPDNLEDFPTAELLVLREQVEPESELVLESELETEPAQPTQKQKRTRRSDALAIEKFRDVLKKAAIKTDGKIIYILFGIESQAEVHYAMVVRCLLYDALQLQEQVKKLARENRERHKVSNSAEFLSGLLPGDRIPPVVTVVFYTGENPWDAATSLHELYTDVPEEVLKFALDYKMNLIEPRRMSEKDFELFRTIMREFCMSLRYANDPKRMKELMMKNERFHNMEREIAELIRDMTGWQYTFRESKGANDVNVPQAVLDYENEIRAEGKTEGRAEGRAEGMATEQSRMIRNMLAAGLSYEMISQISGRSLEYVQSL